LREGRAALHTSIASYKFLITYGLLFSVLKLACYYYGVIMCQVREGEERREKRLKRSTTTTCSRSLSLARAAKTAIRLFASTTPFSVLAKPTIVRHLRSRSAWWSWNPQQRPFKKSIFWGRESNRARFDPKTLAFVPKTLTFSLIFDLFAIEMHFSTPPPPPKQAAYMLIEGIAIICLPYTMTLALPAKVLRQKRPTHGLLSSITMASVLGLWVINTGFTSGALEYMRKAPEYVRWPAKYAAGKDWWTLGDNWEATVLFFCTLFQFITSAVVFSFGSGFTRNVTRNWSLMFVYVFLAGLGVALLLSSDNYLTFVFHIASQEFNDPTPKSPAWIAYQEAGGAPSPGMPFKFRLGLFFMLAGNLACQALWQAAVVTGPVSRVLKKLYPSTRPRFRL